MKQTKAFIAKDGSGSITLTTEEPEDMVLPTPANIQLSLTIPSGMRTTLYDQTIS